MYQDTILTLSKFYNSISVISKKHYLKQSSDIIGLVEVLVELKE